MTNEAWSEIQNNEVVRKRLAKKIVRDCFRDGVFENFHTKGTTLTDNDVKAIMIDAVNRTYKLLSQLSIFAGDHIIGNLKENDEK